MAVNTAAIKSLLRPGLKTVFGDYPMYNGQWAEIFTRNKSDKATEIDVEMRTLTLAQLKTEGASISYDNGMGERYTTTYANRTIGLGFVVTLEAMEDNLYMSQFPMNAAALRSSLAQAKEIQGASVLNNGFSTSFPVGDGAALFSASHPIDNGLVANTFAIQADLNEASLEQAVIGTQKFRDIAGNRVVVKPTKLIVPAELQFTAERLLKTELRTGTANNDVNAMYSLSTVPQGYRVNQFLTDTNAWFLLTSADNGFKYMERKAVATDLTTDFDTKSIKVSAIERYSFGVSNFRAAWGSQGAS
jgi:phage major head subunit gpT-like protein